MTVDIRTALKQVIDPELGIDIVDLGMVRGIEQEGDKATVAIVLTTMSCPFWDLFVDQIQTAVIGVVDGVKEVAVKYDQTSTCAAKRWGMIAVVFVPMNAAATDPLLVD